MRSGAKMTEFIKIGLNCVLTLVYDNLFADLVHFLPRFKAARDLSFCNLTNQMISQIASRAPYEANEPFYPCKIGTGLKLTRVRIFHSRCMTSFHHQVANASFIQFHGGASWVGQNLEQIENL